MDIEDVLKKVEEEVDYAEVRYEKTLINNLVMKNGNIDAVNVEKDKGISIRVLYDGGIGFVSTNDPKDINDLIKRAVKMAKNNKSKLGLSEEKTYKDRWEVKQKKKIEETDLEWKIEYLQDLDRKIMETNVNIPARIFELDDKLIEKEYVNSDGTKISAYHPKIGFFYFVTVVGKTVEQGYKQFGYSGGYEAFEFWDLENIAVEEVKGLNRVANEGKEAPKGKMDLLCGPEVTGIAVHESCGHPTEADRIMGRESSQAGESFIKEAMIGEMIGSEYVNIAEDPTIEHSYGYYKYDEEGVKARIKYLYKEGKINEFLHSRETAYKMGIQSNGAARASSYDREPIPRMANTFFVPGDYTLDELIEDIKFGIYMKSFTEWNIDDKRYNQRYIGRESYIIENGEIKDPVKRPVLEITTPGFYKAVDAAGKDLEFTAGTCGKSDPMQGLDVWMGGPSIRLRNVIFR
ncbi:MAG: TldD/PmbA family protein [Methanomicrobia archaeon]|nr:TldD/PmbA family protein [Methanomicrobia archaeon]